MMPEGTDTDGTLWITAARFADQALSVGESGEGLTWRAADPQHETAYQRMLQVAQDRALLDALTQFDPAVRIPMWQRPRAWASAAATVLVACLCIAVLPPLVTDWTTASTTYTTRPGEIREIALGDGSRVTLNGGSRLEARLTAYRRGVSLNGGEAYFSVTHDASRPFLVELEGGEAKVLGTEFNLSYLDGGVELDVYDGKVRLTGDSRRYGDFTRGMRAGLSGGDIQSLSRFDPGGGDWRKGWIEPDNWPLERVTQALSRQSGVTIRFADANLRQKRVVGRVRLDAPQAQLEALAMVHGFTVEQQGNVIVLR